MSPKEEQRQAVERIVQIAAHEMVRRLAPPSLAYAANAREA